MDELGATSCDSRIKFDPHNDLTQWTVLVVEVRPHLLSGEIDRLFLEDLYQVH